MTNQPLVTTQRIPEEIHLKEMIGRKIHSIRGQNIMLDRDLATLYGVQTFYVANALHPPGKSASALVSKRGSLPICVGFWLPIAPIAPINLRNWRNWRPVPAVLGAASVFGISGLIGVAVIGMFATLCGISVLFLLRPGLLGLGSP